MEEERLLNDTSGEKERIIEQIHTDRKEIVRHLEEIEHLNEPLQYKSTQLQTTIELMKRDVGQDKNSDYWEERHVIEETHHETKRF